MKQPPEPGSAASQAAPDAMTRGRELCQRHALIRARDVMQNHVDCTADGRCRECVNAQIEALVVVTDALSYPAGPEPGSAVAPRCVCGHERRMHHLTPPESHCYGTGCLCSYFDGAVAGAVASEAPRVDLEADRRLPLTPRERREWESARQTWIEIADLRYRQGIEKGLQRAAELCESAEIYWGAGPNEARFACRDAIRAELKGGGT